MKKNFLRFCALLFAVCLVYGSVEAAEEYVSASDFSGHAVVQGGWNGVVTADSVTQRVAAKRLAAYVLWYGVQFDAAHISALEDAIYVQIKKKSAKPVLVSVGTKSMVMGMDSTLVAKDTILTATMPGHEFVVHGEKSMRVLTVIDAGLNPYTFKYWRQESDEGKL